MTFTSIRKKKKKYNLIVICDQLNVNLISKGLLKGVIYII